MFWGCFSYDKKGPYHVWRPETAAEKRKAKTHLEELNKELEPIMKAEWELNTGMRRMGLRNKSGKKPEWRWTEENSKLTRGGETGID